jgi:hypothetical protein
MFEALASSIVSVYGADDAAVKRQATNLVKGLALAIEGGEHALKRFLSGLPESELLVVNDMITTGEVY